jgi:hypothetical protein
VNEADCHHCATRGLHVHEGDDPTNGLTHVEGDVFACATCGACYKRALESRMYSGYTFSRLPHADWVDDALAEAVGEPRPTRRVASPRPTTPSPTYRWCHNCGTKTVGAANTVFRCAVCGIDF